MQIFYLNLWRSNITKTLGDRLKELRKEARLSQQDIADRLNLKSKVSISDYETGKTFPTIEDLKTLAKLFRTTIDYLVTGELNSESRIMKELRDRERELEEIKRINFELLDNAAKIKQVAERQEKYKSKSS